MGSGRRRYYQTGLLWFVNLMFFVFTSPDQLLQQQHVSVVMLGRGDRKTIRQG